MVQPLAVALVLLRHLQAGQLPTRHFDTARARLADADTWGTRALYIVFVSVAATAVSVYCLLISRWIRRNLRRDETGR